MTQSVPNYRIAVAYHTRLTPAGRDAHSTPVNGVLREAWAGGWSGEQHFPRNVVRYASCCSKLAFCVTSIAFGRAAMPMPCRLTVARGVRQLSRVRAARPAGASDDMVTLALRRRLDELVTLTDSQGGPQRWEQLGDCEVCLPSGQFPWGIVFFVGGALLGQYPRLCYDALLRPLADRTGCAVVVVPYETDTDHGALAKVVEARFRATRDLAAERYSWSVDRMPIFGLGHSLGAKLHVIRHSTGMAGVQAEPLAVMAFNNFGLADSLTLAKEALQALQGGSAPPGLDMVWNILQPLAQKAAQNAGLEFIPGPEEMEDMMRAGYTAANTRIIRFGIDRLDCGADLSEAASERGTGPVVSRQLLGDHLTPVLVTVGDLAGAALKGKGAMGERAAAAAQQQTFQVGNEEELDALLEELVAWIRPK